MTGSHPRHLHIARKLKEAGLLQALVIEKREDFVPTPPDGLAEVDRNNFVRHFKDRELAEVSAFGNVDLSEFGDFPILYVSQESINSPETRTWLSDLASDAVVSFGIHKLDATTLDVLPSYAWNIHGGLSPWYRGNVTLFWPFYFLKPNWTGMTIHQLTSKLDGGDIIHHSVPQLSKGQGIHDVASAAVKQVGDDLIEILSLIQLGKVITPVPQKSSGKLFTSADWAPQHLRVIYNTFDNDIVDRYLDGELGQHEPRLVRAF